MSEISNQAMKMTPLNADSLVQRLSKILTLWICGLWLAVSTGVAWYINVEINESLDSALVEIAHRLIDLAEHEIRDLGTDAASQRAASNQIVEPKVESDYLMYQVLASNGVVLLRSADAPIKAMKSSLALGFENAQDRRVYTLKHPTAALFIHVADPLSHRREARNETLLWLLLPLLGILPLLILLVQRTVTLGLKPIRDIATDIQSRSERNLTPIDTQALPLELRVIANSSNSLFKQLETALDTERILAAQAAHELRTPLATARMQLASVADLSAQAEVRQGIDKAIESLKRLSQRTEKLLQMSRAQGGRALSQADVNLNRLCVDVLQSFWVDETVAKRLHLKLDNEGTYAVMVRGDKDTLATALRNLIENALRHAPCSTVWVEVQDSASVSVTDDGNGVDATTLAHLQMNNIQTSHSSAGFGLGLSIVKAVAEKHGAKLTLTSPTRDDKTGFSACLSFNPV